MPTPITDDELFTYAERVKGKVVVITGAASGIGKETALTFGRHGAKVVIGDLDTVGAESVAEAIKKEGGCNVVKWEDQVALFDLAIAEFGAVDIVIPNAGILENTEVCHGNVQFVDGKPVAPKLLTLEVNLIGLFYTVHLGMYYMKHNRTADAWKSLVMIGSIASWVGFFSAQQYTASKHAVLGLMRSLDPIVAGENVRTACIHPWFADTNIIDWKLKVFLAGVPRTPVERIAGAVFRAATDPDPATSGCPWVLPDDGPVLLLKKEVLREGVYGMLDNRVRRTLSLQKTVLFWLAVVRDLRTPLVGAVIAALAGSFVASRLLRR
ncbi:NAD(P)-binding protein [Lactarius hengduanensis]|nr:NAD(P)-binding protein [Lactarius hengduanensis]